MKPLHIIIYIYIYVYIYIHVYLYTYINYLYIYIFIFLNCIIFFYLLTNKSVFIGTIFVWPWSFEETEVPGSSAEFRRPPKSTGKLRTVPYCAAIRRAAAQRLCEGREERLERYERQEIFIYKQLNNSIIK